MLYHIAPRFSVHQGNANCFCFWISDTHTHTMESSLHPQSTACHYRLCHHTLSQTEGVFKSSVSHQSWICCAVFYLPKQSPCCSPPQSMRVCSDFMLLLTALLIIRLQILQVLGWYHNSQDICGVTRLPIAVCSHQWLCDTALRGPCKGISKQGWDNSRTN